jgi:acyl carrier protein
VDPLTLARLQAVRRLEELGAEVEIVKADVADETQVGAVIARMTRKFGVVNGIIHCAGYVKDNGLKPIAQTDAELWQLHFNPKVKGVMALEHAVKDLDLDFSILVSSISTVLGGIGYAAYASANSFLDVFAGRKNAEGGNTRWISVNFDGWRFNETVPLIASDRHKKLAGLAITPQQGREAIARLFTINVHGQVIVSTADLHARIRESIRVQPVTDAAAGAGGDYERPVLAVPYAPARNEVEAAVVGILQKTLRITPVGVDDNFFELGGNSLMGIQILTQVKTIFAVEIPAKTLFERPTAAQLAGFIEAKMLDDIEQLSEEDAETLLNSLDAGQ